MPITNQTLTIVLLKKNPENFEDALKGPAILEEFKLADRIKYDGMLYVADENATPAQWIDFVQPGIEDSIPSQQTTSVAAVLFVRAGARTFAVIFGYGRGLLKKDSYETRFGLKVVANQVDVTRLHSVDTRSRRRAAPGKPGLRTRRHVDSAADLDRFGVHPGGEQFCALAGEPKNTALAKRVAGY